MCPCHAAEDLRKGFLQVSDIAIAVREGADAVMLSGETAYGKFPFKAVDVMSTVAQRTESAMLRFSVSTLSLAADEGVGPHALRFFMFLSLLPELSNSMQRCPCGLVCPLLSQ